MPSSVVLLACTHSASTVRGDMSVALLYEAYITHADIGKKVGGRKENERGEEESREG